MYCCNNGLHTGLRFQSAFRDLKLYTNVIYAYCCSFQGVLRLRGRPTVAYDQQGLVFAVAMEGGAIKLFDSRSYDKVLSFNSLSI